MAGSAYFLVLPKINYSGLASPPMGLSSLISILIKKLSHRLAEVPLHIDDSSFVFSLWQLFTNQHLSVLSSCSESGDQIWELQSPDAHWVLTSALGKFNSFSCCSSTKHSAEGQARSQPTVAHFLCSPFPVPSLLSSSFFGPHFPGQHLLAFNPAALCLGTLHVPPRQAFRTICLCDARSLSAHSPTKDKIKYFLFFSNRSLWQGPKIHA